MPPIPPDALRFFKTRSALRRWLETKHDKASELWIGFYKVGSGKGGVTYKEALDEALCLGWIDGVRKRIDVDAFTIRFSPRRAKSIWSRVNIKRAGELIALGVMAAPGLKVFEARDETRTMRYSFENRPRALPPEYAARFKTNAPAWAFFQGQAPSFQRMAIWWVVSAVKEETRLERLGILIRDSAQGRRISAMVPRAKDTPATTTTAMTTAAATATAARVSTKAPAKASVKVSKKTL